MYAFITLPPYRTKTRIIALAFTSVVVVYILNLHLLLFTGILNPEIAYTIGIVFFTFMLARFLIEDYNSDIYKCNGTFIVYKRPKSIKDFIITLLFKHHAVSIVIDGNEFKFKKGVFMERQHIKKTNVILTLKMG